MINSPNIYGNPLKIAVGLLVISYVLGEFIIPSYKLLYALNLLGILGLISSVGILFSGFNLFKSYGEDPKPNSESHRLIKTGINAYIRNPIYFSLIIFLFSMFLVFENVMYFLSSIGLAIWLHNWVVKAEENYLLMQFKDEYNNYKNSVKRWLFF